MMVADHINYLTFEDPGAVHTVRRALKLAEAGDLYGAAETAGVEVAHAAAVSQGIRRGMRFAIGAEVDNDPRARPDAQNIVDAMRPDGIIRSVHFLTIEHPEKGADYQWAFDNPEFVDLFETVGTERVWELYMAKLLDDIEKLPGHIVGHFYVPAKFGHWPAPAKLEEYEDRMLDACAARGMAVEINTRLLYRQDDPEGAQQYLDALLRLLRKAKAKNVGVAIGSDAHSPKDQGNSFDRVLKLLDEAEINEIVFPVNGRLARVALRATKEHLEKVAAQAPAPQPGSSITGLSRAELGLPERDEAAEKEEREREAAAAAELKRAKKAAAKEPKPPKAPKAPKEPKPAKEPKPPKEAKAPKPAKAPKVVEVPAKVAAKAKPVAAKPVAAKPAAAKPAAAKAKPPEKKAAAAAAKVVKTAAKTVKAGVKKAAVKKTVAKKAIATKKSGVAKKSAVKSTAVKKAAVKKITPVKKTAPAKKIAPAKKTAAGKKTAVKKQPARKATPTPKRTAAKKKTTTKRR